MSKLRSHLGRDPQKRLARAAVAAVLIGILGGAASWSAFSATTENPNNSFATGNVAIEDNDADGAMFSLAGMRPDDTATRCIKVTFTGDLASTVRLYGTTAGTGLDPYLDLTVTRGTYTPTEPAFPSCSNFSADATTYIAGQPAGVVYNGTLQGFADDYAAGLVDPVSGSPESWTNGESHVYRFAVTLQDNSLAQGKTATQTFTWESRDS